MKVIWSRDASAQRWEIRKYIRQDNPAAARKIDKLLGDKAKRLVRHPELGRPGRVRGTRELVAHPNYIIVYELTGDEARVLRVLHAAMSYPPADD